MRRRRFSPAHRRLAVGCLSLNFALAACAGDPVEVGNAPDEPSSAPSSAPASAPASAAVRAPQDPALLSAYGEDIPESGSDGGALADSSAGSSDESAAAPALRDTITTSEPDGGDRPGGTGPGALRAGSVDDNDDFAAYQRYLDGYRGPARELSVEGRHVVTVTDAEGLPLLGARVTARGTTVPSHVDGRALLLGVAAGDDIEVEYGDTSITATLGSGAATVVALDTTRVDPDDLVVDLQLVLDTTGSMGDEIERLNDSLAMIAERLAALPSRPEIRYALTVYRDRGDAYVVRAHDFTDLQTFSDELAGTRANGGGDTPEALDEALHAAVTAPVWGQDPASVELMLLVSDAPSHLKDAEAAPAYVADVAAAQVRGIEVVPLAASGTDDSAEFQFRQLAQQTLGTFFFLTYGADGSPGDGTTHHVDDYETGSLDDQVVEHISARLATYSSAVGTTQSEPQVNEQGNQQGTRQGNEQAPTLPR